MTVVIYYKNAAGERKAYVYGSKIKIPNNRFVENIVNALNEIASTEIGSDVVSTVSNSTADYKINELERFNIKNPETVPKFIVNRDRNKERKIEKGEVNDSYEARIDALKKSDGTFYKGGELQIFDGSVHVDLVHFNTTLILGHELFHAYQKAIGSYGYIALTLTENKNGLLNLAEIQAVGFGNYLRAELGFDGPRLFYSGKPISDFSKPWAWEGKPWELTTNPSLNYFKSDEGKNYWKNRLRQKAVNEHEGAQKK